MQARGQDGRSEPELEDEVRIGQLNGREDDAELR